MGILGRNSDRNNNAVSVGIIALVLRSASCLSTFFEKITIYVVCYRLASYGSTPAVRGFYLGEKNAGT